MGTHDGTTYYSGKSKLFNFMHCKHCRAHLSSLFSHRLTATPPALAQSNFALPLHNSSLSLPRRSTTTVRRQGEREREFGVPHSHGFWVAVVSQFFSILGLSRDWSLIKCNPKFRQTWDWVCYKILPSPIPRTKHPLTALSDLWHSGYGVDKPWTKLMQIPLNIRYKMSLMPKLILENGEVLMILDAKDF